MIEHKKSPVVFGLMRGKGKRIEAVPNDIGLITGKLTVGYHREMQLIKEVLVPASQDLKDCLVMAEFMRQKIKINQDLVMKDKYLYLFSVEETNRLVLQGVPFRDAYKQIGLAIERGEFDPQRTVNHNHEGSIGQLNLEEINAMKEKVVEAFRFTLWEQAIQKLVQS